MVMFNRVLRRLCLLFCIAIIDFFPMIATSQSNIDVQALITKIDRLQRAVTDLERYYLKGGNRPIGVNNLDTQNTKTNGSKSSARNTIRISQFESELRQITGSVEAVDFRLQKMEVRLNKLISDIDQRLASLEGQSKYLMTRVKRKSNTQLLPPDKLAADNNSDRPSSNSSASSVSTVPGVLGTIPENLAVKKARGPVKLRSASKKRKVIETPPVLPEGTPKFQYDYIYKVLQQQNFQKAAVALRAYIDLHPQNALTSNAYFWLGQIYYVQKDYRTAALLFAEGFQKFPQGNKGPDTLLKLGTSLMKLNQMVEACTAFSRFFEDFPEARSDLSNRVKRSQRKAQCL